MKKLIIIASIIIGCSGLALPVHAAPVTDLFTVTLPYASGAYAAGHVFKFAATYDDAGTVMYQYYDGPNGIAQFGAGDDTIEWEYNLSSYSVYGYNLFSDASIASTGFATMPEGLAPYDIFNDNASWYYENQIDVSWYLYYMADNRYFILYHYNTGYEYFDGYTYYLNSEAGVTYDYVSTYSAEGFITRTRIDGIGQVPEPSTIMLLGAGLAGLAFWRRRARR